MLNGSRPISEVEQQRQKFDLSQANNRKELSSRGEGFVKIGNASSRAGGFGT